MIVPIPTKPPQRSFTTPNQSGVFASNPITTPTNVSGSQPSIF